MLYYSLRYSYNNSLIIATISVIISRPYTFNPDPELLNLFKNFEVEETDEVLLYSTRAI